MIDRSKTKRRQRVLCICNVYINVCRFRYKGRRRFQNRTVKACHISDHVVTLLHILGRQIYLVPFPI